MDMVDPFRQGFPHPLRPLPQANFIVEPGDAEKMKWWEPTENAIFRYLKARGITWEYITLINRRDPRREASQHDLTIFISARRDLSSDSWHLMLQDLQGFLQERGLTQLRVEIMDEAHAKEPKHFIVEPSHPLVDAWPNIRNHIIEALGPTPWLSLTAIRRGTDDIPERNPVTILITTPTPSHLYHTIGPIMSICAKAGFTLGVEVLEESGLFGMDNSIGKLLDGDNLTNPIPIGSSVSSKSTGDSSGTIGGGILLTKGHLCMRMAVTSFHVLKTDDIPQVIVENGLCPSQSSYFSAQAVVPSNQDYEYTIGFYRGSLETDIEQPLATAKKRWGLSHEIRDAKRIEELENNKQARRERIDAIQAFECDAGYMWAASGFRVHPQNRFGLDWALIKLPGHRSTPNILPTKHELDCLRRQPYPLSVKKNLEEWSSERVRGGEMVFKTGRTTGLSIGKFNSIKPDVQLDGKICSAWQVVGQNAKPFCEPGDSGSFIFDSNGRWCGLLFATPYISSLGDAFVLPVDTLIADIEKMTGGTVSLP